ncbi:hypothetical protein [Streptomyces sp. NPDC101115]|uniref:hypothetical protein n=1 Tax=Streptomyces sp. NPDC101115 TaxID=3366106 RepID=UPI00381AAA2E
MTGADIRSGADVRSQADVRSGTDDPAGANTQAGTDDPAGAEIQAESASEAAAGPFLGGSAAVRHAADELARGRAVLHGFANFYALTARPDPDVVVRVNRLKGRPDGQTGSVTTVPSLVPGLFDWTRLPAELPRRQVWSLMEELYELGPFGFRGPAADRLPGHLTAVRDGVRTVRVIAPGRLCPSNEFLGAALDRIQAGGRRDPSGAANHVAPRTAPPTAPRTGPRPLPLPLAEPRPAPFAGPRPAHGAASDRDGFLLVTSANRSRELPHWRGDGAVRDFGHEPGVRILAHRDDEAARRRYPFHAPVSVSIVSFHRAAGCGRSGLPALTLERPGSLSAEHLRSVAANHGFSLALAPAAAAGPRPGPRAYLPPVRR